MLHRARGNNAKICREPEETRTAKVIIENKNIARSIILPDVKLYNKATIIKTGWF